MADTSLKDMITYFGYSTSAFMKDWKQMSEQDKTDLRNGFRDGTLTY